MHRFVVFSLILVLLPLQASASDITDLQYTDLQYKASIGDAEAQFALGKAYEEGDGDATSSNR